MQVRGRFFVALLQLASCGGEGGGGALAGPRTMPATKASTPATEPAPRTPPPPGLYLDVVDTDEGGCVLYADGRVACWKVPSLSRPAAPTFIRDISDAVAIESVPGGVQILRRTGKVYKQGLVYGSSNAWVNAPGVVVELAEGCVRLVDGTVHCDCPLSPQPSPLKLEATDIASGGNAKCALTKTGDVECWGQPTAYFGKNWTSGTTDHEGWCPTARASIRFGDATAIVLGHDHACVQKRSGAVVCWGHDDRVGGKRASNAPDEPVSVNIPPAQWLRAAVDATCAITQERDAYCWGNFRHPPVADHMMSWQREPVKLQLERVTAIGQRVSTAIVDDGNRVVSWSWRDGCPEKQCDVIYDIAMPR